MRRAFHHANTFQAANRVVLVPVSFSHVIFSSVEAKSIDAHLTSMVRTRACLIRTFRLLIDSPKLRQELGLAWEPYEW
jgi:hypothetical protein